jgi:hypothetical protein
VYGPYKGCLVKDKIKVKMAGGNPGNKEPKYTQEEKKELYRRYRNLVETTPSEFGYFVDRKYDANYLKLAKKILGKENPTNNEVEKFFNSNPLIPEQRLIINPNSVSLPINIKATAIEMAKNRIISNKGQNFYKNPKHSELVKRATERIARSLAEKRAISTSKETTESLPSFVVNNLNDLPNHVNLNKNFSSVNKSDLVKQLSTLIKIQQRIHELHKEFHKALSNKKQSVINSLSELSKNSKPLSKTRLPSLRNIIPNKTYKSKINFANYNLKESIAKGDIEEKFWELNHYFASISDLISKIQAKLSSSH